MVGLSRPARPSRRAARGACSLLVHQHPLASFHGVLCPVRAPTPAAHLVRLIRRIIIAQTPKPAPTLDVMAPTVDPVRNAWAQSGQTSRPVMVCSNSSLTVRLQSGHSLPTNVIGFPYRPPTTHETSMVLNPCNSEPHRTDRHLDGPQATITAAWPAALRAPRCGNSAPTSVDVRRCPSPLSLTLSLTELQRSPTPCPTRARTLACSPRRSHATTSPRSRSFWLIWSRFLPTERRCTARKSRRKPQ
jgi:hypothetical protein